MYVPVVTVSFLNVPCARYTVHECKKIADDDDDDDEVYDDSLSKLFQVEREKYVLYIKSNSTL
jgi:hypothetical protein